MKMLLAVLRQGLQSIGGALIGAGTMTDDQVNQAIGAVLALVAVTMEVISKKRQQKADDDR